MINTEEVVKNFLNKKPGHLKSGAGKIAKLTGVNDLDLIRRVKRELNKRKKVNINPIVKVPEGMDLEMLRTLYEQLSNMQGVAPAQREGFIKKRRPLQRKDFQKDGIHLLMGCNHVPFHNPILHEGIRELIKDLGDKMVGFHILGDFCDINTLSSHDRGRFTAVPGLTLPEEYKEANKELNKFVAVLPKTCTDRSFIYGNHEDRVHRFNSDMQNAKNPAELPDEALELQKKGFAVHDKWSQDYCTVGDLDIFHGIYFNIHNAKKHLDTFNRNCAYVHTHRVQMYREGDLAAHNIGSCADFTSPAFNYATRAMKQSWANGFALAHVKNGKTYVSQIEVRNGKFFYNGKEY